MARFLPPFCHNINLLGSEASKRHDRRKKIAYNVGCGGSKWLEDGITDETDKRVLQYVGPTRIPPNNEPYENQASFSHTYATNESFTYNSFLQGWWFEIQILEMENYPQGYLKDILSRPRNLGPGQKDISPSSQNKQKKNALSATTREANPATLPLHPFLDHPKQRTIRYFEEGLTIGITSEDPSKYVNTRDIAPRTLCELFPLYAVGFDGAALARSKRNAVLTEEGKKMKAEDMKNRGWRED